MVLHSCCSWALVCKPWLQTFCDPVFLRRYRAFHRAPPLLGLPHMPQCFPYHGVAALPLPGRAPLARGPSTAATAAPSSTSRTGAAAGTSSSGTPSRATSSACRSRASPTGWSTPPWCSALSPAAMRPPRLPRLGPFPVAFIANNNDLEQDDKDVKASPYAIPSDADHVFFCYIPHVHQRRGAIVGDEIYFALRPLNVIAKYDWSNNYLSMINPPSPEEICGQIALMVTDDGSLGFACFKDSSLFLWSRKENSQGGAEWVLYSWVVELEKLIPDDSPPNDKRVFVVGSAEGVGVIFVSTDAGLFTLALKTERVKKRSTLHELLHSRYLY
ncbi:hypothetical protein HU200_016340 [Digitaria exilis]|uniref:Uncharacterized protein n=1 Tax=Digitaria exilis TaxID=1010633 RepID=A0A835F833_9POAL|nr:hypothetical protein HU200_016340 [Digitaria exilis]